MPEGLVIAEDHKRLYMVFLFATFKKQYVLVSVGSADSCRLLRLEQLIAEAPVIEHANMPVKPVQIPS